MIHIGGDEVNAEGLQFAETCLGHKLTQSEQRNFEKRKQEFIGNVIRRASRLGVDVQVWDDAVASKYELPRDTMHWKHGNHNIFVNAWNSNRRSNAFAYANAGYKVAL